MTDEGDLLFQSLSTCLGAMETNPQHATLVPILKCFIAVIGYQQKTINSMLLQQQELLKTIQSNLNHQMPAAAPPILDMDSSAEEMERRRSVVVCGLPEAEGSPSARREGTRKASVELLNALNIDSEIISTYRLGRPPTGENNKPRLLKIVFPNSNAQKEMLRKARGLRGQDQYNGVYIRPSLTPAQLNAEYLLRKELRERRGKGETCRIVGGPPGAMDRKVVNMQMSEN